MSADAASRCCHPPLPAADVSLCCYPLLRVADTSQCCQPLLPFAAVITLLVVQRVFLSDSIINTGLWPPRSPDLNPCNRFLLVEHTKDKLYRNNPRHEDGRKKKFRIWYFQFHQQNLDVRLTSRFLRVTCDCKPKEAISNYVFKYGINIC